MTYSQRKAKKARQEAVKVALVAFASFVVICLIGLFVCVSMNFTGLVFVQCMALFTGIAFFSVVGAVMVASFNK